jgi:integrase
MAAPRHHYKGIPITQDAAGVWHAKATVGHRPDGGLDRRHRAGPTVEAVKEKLRKLLSDVDADRSPRPGRPPTVAEWVNHWLTAIAPVGRRKLAPKTLESYWSLVRCWIVPHLGRLRLDALEPESLDAMYAAMRTADLSDGTLLKVHAIVRRALAVAQARGRVSRNVATMIDPPGEARPKRTPLSTEAAQALIREAQSPTRRHPARWLLGLTIGSRQGEILGLCWPQVDLELGTVEICWQLQRLTWQHGCSTACGQRAAACPQRHGGGLVLRRPKTWRETNPPRVVALGPRVLAALRELRRVQTAERLRAGNLWRRFPHPGGGDADFVFRQVDGAPIDPRRDWGEFQQLLLDAGFGGARVHSMRHTAATTLVDLGVDLSVVQEILGHAQIQTTRGYVTVRTTATAAAAAKMEAALFDAPVTDLVTERARRRTS